MHGCVGKTWWKRWSRDLVAGVTLAIVIQQSGCAHKSSTAAAPATPLTGSNLSSVDAGRAIYTGQCTACHSAETVTNYTADEWTNRIIPSMARKAGLSSDEKQAVTDYVLSVLNASS